MKKRLRVSCLAVFFRSGAGWKLAKFEGEGGPCLEQALLEGLITKRIIDRLASLSEGFVAAGLEELSEFLGEDGPSFAEFSVIGAPVRRGSSIGVRLAWRPRQDRFTQDDLPVIECFGNCPPDCLSDLLRNGA